VIHGTGHGNIPVSGGQSGRVRVLGGCNSGLDELAAPDIHMLWKSDERIDNGAERQIGDLIRHQREESKRIRRGH
jgi:hypothetical protein